MALESSLPPCNWPHVGDELTRKRLKVMGSLLLGAGQLIKAMNSQLAACDIEYKSSETDLVTQADKACDSLLKEVISREFPLDAILTEESGLILRGGGSSKEVATPYKWDQICKLDSVWIADPIDGTMNYVHQLENYAVCLAWMSGGSLELAGLYLPVLGELFLAARGHGCYCNGERIYVSSTKEISKGLIATGFGYFDQKERRQHLAQVDLIAESYRGIRHIGSAACSMAKVAQGRFDGFWIRQVKPWDVACGILMIEEAGGCITPLEEGVSALESGSLIASNAHLAPFLAQSLREIS